MSIIFTTIDLWQCSGCFVSNLSSKYIQVDGSCGKGRGGWGGITWERIPNIPSGKTFTTTKQEERLSLGSDTVVGVKHPKGCDLDLPSSSGGGMRIGASVGGLVGAGVGSCIGHNVATPLWLVSGAFAKLIKLKVKVVSRNENKTEIIVTVK